MVFNASSDMVDYNLSIIFESQDSSKNYLRITVRMIGSFIIPFAWLGRMKLTTFLTAQAIHFLHVWMDADRFSRKICGETRRRVKVQYGQAGKNCAETVGESGCTARLQHGRACAHRDWWNKSASTTKVNDHTFMEIFAQEIVKNHVDRKHELLFVPNSIPHMSHWSSTTDSQNSCHKNGRHDFLQNQMLNLTPSSNRKLLHSLQGTTHRRSLHLDSCQRWTHPRSRI